MHAGEDGICAGNGTGIRARLFWLAHVARLPALLAAGRVAPRPGLAVRIAAVVVVADALGSRTGGSRPVAVTAVALALYFPRQARETALRLAHGAAVVCCLAVLVALRCGSPVAVEHRAACLVLAYVVVATPAVGVARLTSASIPNPEQLMVVQ